MKAKIVSTRELLDPRENPTVCLSPLRVFNDCHKCEVFQRARRNNEIGQLKCRPHLDPKMLKLLNQRNHLIEKIKEMDAKLINP